MSTSPCTYSIFMYVQVHWEMAKYHEIGRFSENQTPDMESALYHLNKAARGGVSDALYTLAHIHLQQPHDDFKEISMEVCIHTHAPLNFIDQMFRV